MTREFVEQILKTYFTKVREPKIEELTVPETLANAKWNCFVTLYLNGEVHGSAGNIKETKTSLAEELLENTMHALTKDKRFTPLTREQAEKLQFRVDVIQTTMIQHKELRELDPTKSGVLAIKRDYEKLAVILPNISPKLVAGDDFTPVLLKKLSEKKLSDKEFIFYKVASEVETNY